MSVWDVPDERIRELGQKIGELDFVSHCYHRPRHLPGWPYNLFAMVHGRDRPEVEAKVAQIAALLGESDRGHTVLYSTRILKKTGLRIGLIFLEPQMNTDKTQIWPGKYPAMFLSVFIRVDLWFQDLLQVLIMFRISRYICRKSSARRRSGPSAIHPVRW